MGKLLLKGVVKRLDAEKIGMRPVISSIEGGTNLDVFLREIVAVNQHFANLVGGIGILALVGSWFWSRNSR